MSGKYLFDTNVIIALFSDDTAIKNRLRNAEVFVPSIALGELYYGAYKYIRREANVKKVEEFSESSLVLVCDADTARSYGNIKDRLRQKGQPIPENDIWIAAIALQHDLILATRDAHFRNVESLNIEMW